MFSFIFSALVTFNYPILPGKVYQACYKPDGLAEVCTPMSATPKFVTVADDTVFDFYMRIDGEQSEVTRIQTAKKKLSAPLLSVEQ